MATTTNQPDPTIAGEAGSATGMRRPALLLAAAAGLCWAAAVGLLLTIDLAAEPGLLAPPRLIFYGLVLAAGLLTFVPTQRQLQLPGLALEGIAGSFLLLYILAFVPPPTAWLLSLPDTPVYLIFALAMFWSVSAIAIPVIHTIGKRAFRQRARQYDLRRARRQAHEAGALVALCAGLAGLRVLTPLAVAVLALILIIAELLFLSFVETET